MEQQAELNLPHVNFEEESRCAGSFNSHGGVNDVLETSKVDELGQTKDGVGNAKPSQQSSKEELLLPLICSSLSHLLRVNNEQRRPTLIIRDGHGTDYGKGDIDKNQVVTQGNVNRGVNLHATVATLHGTDSLLLLDDFEVAQQNPMLAAISDDLLPLTQADGGLTKSTKVVKPFIFSSPYGPPKLAGKSENDIAQKGMVFDTSTSSSVKGWKRVGMVYDSLEAVV
ncbi:hypothetical protein ACOSQ3_007703 [Xanthoceras sorbifolium]